MIFERVKLSILILILLPSCSRNISVQNGIVNRMDISTQAETELIKILGEDICIHGYFKTDSSAVRIIDAFPRVESEITTIVFSRLNLEHHKLYIALVTQNGTLLRMASIEGLCRSLPEGFIKEYIEDSERMWGIGNNEVFRKVLFRMDSFIREVCEYEGERKGQWIDIYFLGREMISYRYRMLLLIRATPSIEEPDKMMKDKTEINLTEIWDLNPPEIIRAKIIEEGTNDTKGFRMYDKKFHGRFKSNIPGRR